MLFPSIITDSPITRVILDDATAGDDLPDVLAVVSCTDPAAYHGLPRQTPRRTPLLAEHALGLYGRPSLRGHRVISDDGDVATGLDWSPRFILDHAPAVDGGRLAMTAHDVNAGLSLATEIEPMVGGSLRIRHALTNVCPGSYVVDGLEVCVPLRDDQNEFIDFTGRHENERQPQRHRVADGTWVREFRRGKPSFEGTALIAGTEDFCFGSGSMLGVQPAWSGSCSTTAGSMPAARIPPDWATGGSTAASGRTA